MIATFMGSLGGIGFFLDHGEPVCPVVFLYKALMAADAANPERVIRAFEQGSFVMLIYIIVFGGISYWMCLRNEY